MGHKNITNTQTLSKFVIPQCTTDTDHTYAMYMFIVPLHICIFGHCSHVRPDKAEVLDGRNDQFMMNVVKFFLIIYSGLFSRSLQFGE